MPTMMTEEENYCFDVAGYVIVRGVLSSDELRACNSALDEAGESSGMLDWGSPRRDPFVNLRDHRLLVRYLEDLSHESFRLEREPWLVGDGDLQSNCLSGGNEPRDPRRIYHQQNESRFCQGVLAVWALTDVEPGGGGFVLVPASHKSCVETPSDLMKGADDLGVVRQPALRAGDLLLCAETTLHGVRPWTNGTSTETRRLLAFGYGGRKDRSVEEEEPEPEWVSELGPEQQALVRTSETSRVMSDGQKSWVEEEAGVFHPSILTRDLNSLIDETELYQWDLNGHLVLRNVMDSAWLGAANTAIDACADRIQVGGEGSKGFKALAGTGIMSLHGLFELPQPHCEPFRKMIADPIIVHRLNWMMGTGFQWRSARAICSVKGTSGHGLHSGGDPVRPANVYALQNGRTYCEAVNVAWQLRDVTEADGGFMCLPGSHKARYPVPQRVQSFEQTMGLVEHVEMEAGDTALFLAAAQTHGAYPWKSDVARRTVLLGYSLRNPS